MEVFSVLSGELVSHAVLDYINRYTAICQALFLKNPGGFFAPPGLAFLLQKSGHYLLLRLSLREAEGHELHYLVACYLADGRLMD